VASDESTAIFGTRWANDGEGHVWEDNREDTGRIVADQGEHVVIQSGGCSHVAGDYRQRVSDINLVALSIGDKATTNVDKVEA
jgi:hypothetical protein